MSPRIILLSIFVFAACDANPLSFVQQRGANIQLCGERLAKVLGDICQGDYNTMFEKKSNLWLESSPANVNKYKSERKSLYNSKWSVYSVAPKRSRYPHKGVYDECCLKSCSFSELFSYCGSSY